MYKQLLLIAFGAILGLNATCQIWNPAAKGFNGSVSKVFTVNNNLYAGGNFTASDTAVLNHIAKWNGTAWSSVGAGFDSAVYAIASFQDTLYAGGSFIKSGTDTVKHVAKWNGTKWMSLDSGLNGNIYCLAEYKGSLYAGGSFSLSGATVVLNIAKWDGVIWSPVSIGFDSTVRTLVVIDSILYAGGSFTKVDGNIVNNIAKWDSTQWKAVGNGMNGDVYDLKKFKNEIYAVGSFTKAEDTTVNYIAKWNGAYWSPVNIGANSKITSLEQYDSSLYVAGYFTSIDTISAKGIAKYNGEKWSSAGAAIDTTQPLSLKTFNDELFVGGNFTSVNNSSFLNIARIDPCPKLGDDKSRTIVCAGETANIANMFDTTGLNLAWNIPNPAKAPFGIHQLIATNKYGCKDSAQVTVAGDFKNWLGFRNSNWNDTANWTGNKIPNDSTHVIINGNTPYPCIVDSDVSFASLDVINGAQVNVMGGHNINVKAHCDSVPPNMIFWPYVKIIDSSLYAFIQYVDSETVIFNGTDPVFQNLAVNDYMVSGVSANAPYGFMRKITGVQHAGATTTCNTIGVSFTEVFKELHIDNVKPYSGNDTLLKQRSQGGIYFNVPLNNVILYDLDKNEGTTYDQVKIDGTLTIHPDFHFYANINPWPVRLDNAKIECNFETSLNETITAGGSVGSFSKKINIFSKPLSPILIPGPFGIVIPIVPVLRVSLGAEASINVEMSASYTHTSTITPYIEYKNNEWDKGITKSSQNTFTFSGIDGNASAKIYIEPAIDFKVGDLDAAKGSILAQVYLKANGTLFPTHSCELRAGINAGVEANLQIFDWLSASASYPDIIDYSVPLYTCQYSNLPTVYTTALDNITATTAVSGGNITSDGGAAVTARGICWSSTNKLPTTSDNNIASGSGSGMYSCNLTNLLANTKYYVRAFATNSVGTAYGTTLSFTTLQAPALPVLTTIAASSVTQTSALTGGIITSSGTSSVTARGICWALTGTPTLANNVIYNGSGSGSYTISMTGLTVNTTYYVRAFATNSVGTAYGNTISFTAGSTAITSVTICNQVWMTKNLDVTTYRNGDPIPQVTDATAWANLTTGAWCYYNNDPANNATYGKLYNWYAVNDARGLAPAGWHIPTDAEWTTLTTCLGGTSVAGGAMKETGTTHWSSPNTGAANSSGFAGLPGGSRANNGMFFSIGYFGHWWSSTEYLTSLAWYRDLYYYYPDVYRGNYYRTGGFSVRCVRD